MIIVEGPDGAGKTTLVNDLVEATGIPQHERASTSTGGPVPNIFEWAKADVLTWPVQDLAIYDRHPLFSEPIYGAVLRGGYDHRFMADEGRPLYEHVMSHGLIIMCLPPLAEVESNLAEDDNQLAGVEMNAQELWAHYARLYHRLKNAFNKPYLFRYDYTKDDFEDVLAVVAAHQVNWRRKYGA